MCQALNKCWMNKRMDEWSEPKARLSVNVCWTAEMSVGAMISFVASCPRAITATTWHCKLSTPVETLSCAPCPLHPSLASADTSGFPARMWKEAGFFWIELGRYQREGFQSWFKSESKTHSRMFGVLKTKKFSNTVPYGEKLVAFEKAAPDICVTGSGYARHLIIKCPGASCFMSKWPSTHHRLLLQRCLGSPFILPVTVTLR